jgi:hypothetical protein
MAYLYNLDASYGASISGDTTATPALTVKNGAAANPVISIARNAAGSQTIGLMKLGGSSLASGALIEFGGGFISCTSVVLTSVANADYCIPVQVGLETRYIPTFKAAAIVGGAAF